MYDSLNRISSEAVQKATGRSWNEWITLLDNLGFRDKPHKEIAKMLYKKGYIKKGKGWPASRSFSIGWWCQMVTVGYEYAHNKRVIGGTETAGYEIGVQKTFPVSPKKAWELLTNSDGIKVWLGSVESLNFQKGEIYTTKEGTTGEIRTVDPGKRLRFTWKPRGRKDSATIQIYFLPTGNNTSIRFHQEKLASTEERDKMRSHWQSVLNRLSDLCVKGDKWKHL